MFDEAVNRIAELKAQQAKEIEAVRKEMQAHPEKWVALFADLPDYVVGIHWLQYTPYFNDGEPCEFSVGEPSFLVTKAPPFAKYQELSTANVEYFDVDESGLDGEQVLAYNAYWSDKDKEWFVPFERIIRLIQGQDEIMEALFGGHVQVVITRSGITTTEYSHD